MCHTSPVTAAALLVPLQVLLMMLMLVLLCCSDADALLLCCCCFVQLLCCSAVSASPAPAHAVRLGYSILPFIIVRHRAPFPRLVEQGQPRRCTMS